MFDYLNDIDTDVLLAVNGMHNAFQDALWWMVSAKWSSLLIIITLIWVLLHQNRRHALLALAMLALALLVADQISSGLIKQLVERLRPTHDPVLGDAVHIVNGYRGGLYGFVSSHAANSFAAATFIALLFRNRAVTIGMTVWALLQCYSRIYLGVHYPGDILGGLTVGLLSGWLVWLLMGWIQRHWRIPRGFYTRNDATILVCAIGITLLVILVAATFQVL